MGKQTFEVGSPVRVGGVLYRENERFTCEAKDLLGVEHCVRVVDVEAEEAAAKEAAAAEKAAAEEKAKAKPAK